MGVKEVSFTSNPAAPTQPTQPWQQNSQDLMRQRAMLTALAGQNMAPKGLTQVSGHVVNTALPDAIQRIAGALMLKNGMADLDKREAAINAAQMTAQNNARARLAQLNPRDMPGLLAASNEIGATGVDITKDPNYAALLEIAKQAEIEKGKTDKWGNPVKAADNKWVQFGDKGGVRPVEGFQPPPEIDIVNGVAVDKSKMPPGTVAPPNYNDLVTLGPDGKPQVNQALLDAKKQVAASGASNISIGQPVAVQLPNGDEAYVQFPNKPGASPVVTPYKPPASGKMSASTQQQRDSLDALDGSLAEYESKVRNFNPRSLNQLSPQARADIESAHARVIIALKEADRLGALQKPDLEIMEKAITNPATFKGIWYGEGGLSQQIANARAHAKNLRSTIEKNYGGKKQGPTQDGGGWQDIGGGVKIRKN